MTRILVVDNHDSFVHTILDYLTQLGATCELRRNDHPTTQEPRGYDGVLISPGPGSPEHAGNSIDTITWCAHHHLPMLGVCLGHQALAAAYGGTVRQAPELLHGRTSPIHHHADGIFAGLPAPFTATRYHSLAVEDHTLPEELVVTARTDTGVVMGLAHRRAPLFGVQFHPESILTEGGYRLLANWLHRCGAQDAVRRASALEGAPAPTGVSDSEADASH